MAGPWTVAVLLPPSPPGRLLPVGLKRRAFVFAGRPVGHPAGAATLAVNLRGACCMPPGPRCTNSRFEWCTITISGVIHCRRAPFADRVIAAVHHSECRALNAPAVTATFGWLAGI